MALLSNTQVLTFDGKIKSLDELEIGELLLGPDSNPRKVLSIEKLFSQTSIEVKPAFGKSIFASTNQVLVLRKSIYLRKVGNDSSRKIKYRWHPDNLPITIENILQANSKALHKCYFLQKGKLNFEYQPISIDPYFLGLWLGDGSKHKVSITTIDEEIVKEVYKQASIYGLNVSVATKNKTKACEYTLVRGNVSGYGRHKNPILNLFKELNLIGNKHIPDCFIRNSEDVRLKLLAGIIDTDGYQDKNVYYVFQKSKKVATDIIRLANTLGFRSYCSLKKKKIRNLEFEGIYYSITISGKLNRIPVRLTRKRVINPSERFDRQCIGFKLLYQIEKQDMISIKVSGDNLFVLDDGTIVAGMDYLTKRFDSYYATHQEDNWNKSLQDLLKFVEENKKYPSMYSKGLEKSLAYWVNNVRQDYLKSQLTLPRISKLRTANFRFNALSFRLKLNLQYVMNYYSEFKRLPRYDSEYPKGIKIGRWWSMNKKRLIPNKDLSAIDTLELQKLMDSYC